MDNPTWTPDYEKKVFHAAAEKLPNLEKVWGSGVWSHPLDDGHRRVLATPFWESSDSIPIEFEYADDQNPLTYEVAFALTGDPEADAERYSETLLEEIQKLETHMSRAKQAGLSFKTYLDRFGFW